MNARTHPGFTAIALTLALLAGCGGLEKRTPAPDPAAVHIGCIRYQDGDLVDDLWSYGAAMAVEEINARGGVLGKRLQLLANTDRPDAPNGLPGTRDLLASDVVAIVGAPTSALHLQMVQLTAPAGVPLLSPNATSPALSDLTVPGLGMVSGTYSFRTAPSDTLQGRFLAERIRAEGIQTMGVLYRNDTYGRGVLAPFRERFEELGGQLTAAVGYEPNTLKDLRAQVETLLASGLPQGVLLLSFTTDGTALTQHLAALLPRPRPRFFGTDGIDSLAFWQNAEPEITEDLHGSAAAFPDSPAIQSFHRTYRSALGEPATPSAVYAYDAIYSIALALEAGGAATPYAVRSKLRAITGGLGDHGMPVTASDFAQAVSLARGGKPLDFQGLTGRLDLDARGDPTQANYAWWRFRKGAVEILSVSEVRGAAPLR